MKKFVLTLILLVSAQPVWAAVDQLNIDTSHSAVGFKIRHLFGTVPGRFTQLGGTIEYDATKPEASKVTVEISADSVNTDNKDRDKHLCGPDFFDVAKFPKLSFRSTSVKPAGPNKLAVTGDLTIRDKTKPVILDVEILGYGKDPWGGERGGFHATTKINRKDFGVSFNKVLDNGSLMLGEDVNIDLSVEAVKAKPAKK